MSTPTNIPESPMGEPKQDSYFKSNEKFQQQLQHIFQTTLKLTRPDLFDQLCQWMEYNQYLTIDDFYHSSYNDPEKFDTEGPATEYKWKGKMNHLSLNVAQKLKSFVRWMSHECRAYELHDDFLATLTRDDYLKFRNLGSQSFKSFSASSPSHHEPYKHQVKKRPQRKAFFPQQEEIIPMKKSNFPLIKNQRNLLHILFINHHSIPRCHRSFIFPPTSGKHFLRAPNK